MEPTGAAMPNTFEPPGQFNKSVYSSEINSFRIAQALFTVESFSQWFNMK